MNRLNFFNPFLEKEATHEDVLTRNFLILVKNIPTVQIAFLELIRSTVPDAQLESIALGELVVTDVTTQVVSGGMLAGTQECSIMSVYISDDKLITTHSVEASERNARYDGVIKCDPSWVFIIENKPYVGNAWIEQLDPNKEDASGNIVLEKPCCLSWRDILFILGNILEHNLASSIETIVIEDFLNYVNENFSWLNPFNRLGLCKGNKGLIDKRCGVVIESCFAGKELKYHKGWKSYIDTSREDYVVKQVALDTDERSITLWMYGGDTMNSARSMYCTLDLEKMKKLIEEGYEIESNFHLSFRSSNLAWFKSAMNVVDYAKYWKEQTKINQVNKEEVENYCKCLGENKVLVEDKELLVTKILSKQYKKINVCPGIFFGFNWPIEEAIQLDNEGRFVNECKEKIRRIRECYKVELGDT